MTVKPIATASRALAGLAKVQRAQLLLSPGLTRTVTETTSPNCWQLAEKLALTESSSPSAMLFGMPPIHAVSLSGGCGWYRRGRVKKDQKEMAEKKQTDENTTE